MNYFTSDLHFGHTAIISFCNRPYHDTNDMRVNLIANINSIVKPNDVLYILGDFSFYPKDNNVSIIKDIKCPMVLIRGNHDYSSRIKNVPFVDVYNELDIQIGEYVVTMSHYPYRGDHTAKERYIDRRPKDSGNWLLHGHTHSKQRYNIKEHMIHVGVDAWSYYPISEIDILNIIGSRL